MSKMRALFIGFCMFSLAAPVMSTGCAERPGKKKDDKEDKEKKAGDKDKKAGDKDKKTADKAKPDAKAKKPE